MISFGGLLRSALGPGYPVTDLEAAAMEAHWQLVLRWNPRLNLTAIRDTGEAVRRHYAESVVAARFIPSGRWRVADVGSGAGYPGIPIAIARPECSVTLIESDVRKSVFLREASVALPNVRVEVARFEQFTGPVDWLVSRAVKPEIVLKGAKRLGCSSLLLVSRPDAERLGVAELHDLPGHPGSVVAISKASPNI